MNPKRNPTLIIPLTHILSLTFIYNFNRYADTYPKPVCYRYVYVLHKERSSSILCKIVFILNCKSDSW